MNEDYEKYFKGDEELEVINIKWFIYLIPNNATKYKIIYYCYIYFS